MLTDLCCHLYVLLTDVSTLFAQSTTLHCTMHKCVSSLVGRIGCLVLCVLVFRLLYTGVPSLVHLCLVSCVLVSRLLLTRMSKLCRNVAADPSFTNRWRMTSIDTRRTLKPRWPCSAACKTESSFPRESSNSASQQRRLRSEPSSRVGCKLGVAPNRSTFVV